MDIVTGLKLYGVGMVLLVALDLLWLGVLMSKFYQTHLGHLMKTGMINIPAAILTWMLIMLGIVFFVVPNIPAESGVALAFAIGALFGLVLYGVYDLTNFAMVKDWPLIVVIVDMLWGMFLCGFSSALLFFVNKRFF